MSKARYNLKPLNLLSVLFLLTFGSLFAAGCSTSDESVKSLYILSADNVSANVIDNEQGVTTEAYFTALNRKLQDCSAYYASEADAKDQLTSSADQAIADFEQTAMANVAFYGRFTVGYRVYGTDSGKTVLKEYTNKPLSEANLTKALTKIAAANPDGFTVDATTLEPLTKGYAVSLEATQNSFGSEGLARVVTYVTTHTWVNAYGGWLNTDNGQYYYDATVICTSLEEAKELARENNQIAIFDLENMEEIRL